MVCVRCGTRLGVGKLICERCGTAVGVDEGSVKNVSVKKLESGDLIYFMPEIPLIPETADTPADSIEDEVIPEAPPVLNHKANNGQNSESETRKTIFKYMSESKSRLEEKKPAQEVKPAAHEPIIPEEETVLSDALDKPQEDEAEDFWGNIDEVETGLRTAAETINKSEITEEAESPEHLVPEPKEASAADEDDLPAAPREFLYRTEYKKSAEAMTEAPNVDYEFKAPLGMKTVSPEIITLIESQKEKSMSATEWLSTVILLLIPGVNLIALIVWALGGCKKMQKTLFARAVLILILILLVLSAAAYFVFFRNTLKFDTGFLNNALNNVIGIFQRIGSAIRGIFRI